MKSMMRLPEFLSDRPSLIKTFFMLAVVAILDETSFGVTAVKESVRHEKIVRRATTMFDNMEKAYESFYTQLTTFVEGIPDKLTSDAPKALSTKVSALTKLISPGDKSFTSHAAKTIEKRSKLTLAVTQNCLKAVEKCHYSKDETWFSKQKLQLKITIVVFEFGLKSYLESPEGVGDVTGGAGGVNPGVDALDPDVLGDIKDLLGSLKC